MARAVKTGIIILAAGSGRRMGGDKMAADLGGRPLLGHVVDAATASGLPRLLVLGHDAERVRHSLGDRPIPTVVAEDHAQGIGRSIAAGVNAVDWDAAILCLGDMPLVDPALLRLLAEQASRDAILVPVCGSRRGNPVLWGRDHFAALAALSGDVGGRALFAGRAVREIPWDDAGIVVDVDTPEELALLRARLAASGG